jgi:anti-sigma factor RsiW
MNDPIESFDTRTFPSCESYVEAAHEYVLESGSSDTLTRIQSHMRVCPDCHSRLADLLKADASMRTAFKMLDDTVPAVHDQTIDRILTQVRETPETAVLLHRIRRPVNVMLMITVLTGSTAALAVLAWLVYWLTAHSAG